MELPSSFDLSLLTSFKFLSLCRKQRETGRFLQEPVRMKLQSCDHTDLFIPGQVCGLSSPEDHKLSFLTALLRPGKYENIRGSRGASATP